MVGARGQKIGVEGAEMWEIYSTPTPAPTAADIAAAKAAHENALQRAIDYVMARVSSCTPILECEEGTEPALWAWVERAIEGASTNELEAFVQSGCIRFENDGYIHL